MRRLTLIVAATLFFAACKGGESKSGESHLKGKIFVTLETGETFKFGGIQVGLIPKDGKGLRVTESDNNGEFEFRVPKGLYTVQATGYRALSDNKAETSYWSQEINLDEDEETISLNNKNRW